MTINKLLAGLLFGAIQLVAQGNAQAAVTFESVATMSAAVSTPLSSDGFVFSSDSLFHGVINMTGVGASNGTNFLVYGGTGVGSETFSAMGNTLFNLDSIDLGGWLNFQPATPSIVLTGFKPNGETVTQSFLVSRTFATYQPVNFKSLVRVALGRSSNSAYVAVDNIVTTPVPEPESFAMLLAGLSVLAGVQTRRRKKVVSK